MPPTTRTRRVPLPLAAAASAAGAALPKLRWFVNPAAITRGATAAAADLTDDQRITFVGVLGGPPWLEKLLPPLPFEGDAFDATLRALLACAIDYLFRSHAGAGGPAAASRGALLQYEGIELAHAPWLECTQVGWVGKGLPMNALVDGIGFIEILIEQFPIDSSLPIPNPLRYYAPIGLGLDNRPTAAAIIALGPKVSWAPHACASMFLATKQGRFNIGKLISHLGSRGGTNTYAK